MKHTRDVWSFILGEDNEKVIGKNLPDPDLLNFYARLSRREIFINEIIDEYVVEYSLYIFNWNKEDKGIPIEDRKPIFFFINSDGGCLNSIMMLIDAIDISVTPVYTIALGKAYSSGGLLLMAGHKNKRLIFPNTCVLIHDGSTGASGATGKVIDSLEFTKALEEKTKKYICAKTNITSTLYNKNYRKDWWIFAEEILSLGVADKVITSIDEI